MEKAIKLLEKAKSCLSELAPTSGHNGLNFAYTAVDQALAELTKQPDVLEIICDYIKVNEAQMSQAFFAEKHGIPLHEFMKVSYALEASKPEPTELAAYLRQEVVPKLPSLESINKCLIIADEFNRLTAEIEELKQRIQRAKTYTGFEGYPCPLCTYKDGKFVESCELHKTIHELQAKLKEKDG